MEQFPISLMHPDEVSRLFSRVPNQPKQMYIRGKLPETHIKFLTIIGSRKFTRYGHDVTDHLVRSLAGLPVCIVSGLALGIDMIALQTALDVGLPTIAIPGSGIDDSAIYPRQHFGSAQKILESGGAIMSEFEPTQPGMLWTFPTRNRLMAGMADVVLVIEAENKSGTRITAKLATDYNVDVLAVPGSIFSSASIGTNQLIREGATPITSAEELRQALGFQPDATTTMSSDERLKDSNPVEKKIWEIIATPTSRDDLIRTLEKPATEVSMALSIMEIKGLIKEVYGEIRRN